MSPKHSLALGAAILLTISLIARPASAFTISFSSGDFGKTNVYSTVNTFAFEFEITGPMQIGAYADPGITNIQYSVSGSLDSGTPSGFPSFAFQLNHIFPGSPPGNITGADFYPLNTSLPAGQTLLFEIAAAANLSDGLQINELVDLGGGVVFRFNGSEEGTGRYHPAFIELNSDGTGTIQNGANVGGINPATMEEVNVAPGQEYITALTFTPSTLTIAVPEPSCSLLVLVGIGAMTSRRRRQQSVS